jgi:23S rRNA (uracil1939-C5)-methyltransferase
MNKFFVQNILKRLTCLCGHLRDSKKVYADGANNKIKSMHKIGDIITVKITDLAFGGKGVGKTDEGYVAFVDGAFPGQTVKARLKKCKKSFAHAKIAEILEASPDEIETNYQSIPGAPWAKLPLEVQHQYKQKIVTDLFKKFAKTDIKKAFDKLVPSPLSWSYRNKMEYSFGPDENQKFSLGSKKRGQFTIVEDLKKPSGIFAVDFESKMPLLRDYLESTKLPVYIQGEHKGFFRNLVVRKSFDENAYLINLVTSTQDAENFDAAAFTDFAQKTYGEKLKGLFWTISDHAGDPVNKYQERKLLTGTEILTETLMVKPKVEKFLTEPRELKPLEFSVSLHSFFQPNPKAAEKLYRTVARYADLQDNEVCYDLFCGTGTIAQVMAQQVPSAHLVGVEIIADAVKDAKSNAHKNELKNCQFICADVRKFLKEKLHKRGSQGSRPSTIIIDPPRAGLHPKSLQRVLECRPNKIVYVSCNPATMARDTEKILAAGYDFKKISLVDQFPHTSHIECVGKFVKNEQKSVKKA